MKNKIVLESSQKGFVSQYFWSIIWLCFLGGLALWVSGFKESADDISFPLLHICMYILYIIMGIIILCTFHTLLYGSREINTFSQNEEGHCYLLSGVTYGFPFSRNLNQVFFDRIIQVDVRQESISRILDTGSLSITMVTFTNADSKNRSWTIPAIKEPYKRKVEIEKTLMGHEGLRVKITG